MIIVKSTSNKSTEKSERYYLLDGLRGVAALGVMARHLWLQSNGWVGLNMLVDFFFVLSGFVLAPQLVNMKPSGRKGFVTKRIVRLWPTLIPVFLLIIAQERIPVLHVHGNTVVHSVYQYLGAFLLLQLYLPSLISVNDPLWSLSAEFLVNVAATYFLPNKSNLKRLLLTCIALQILGIWLSNKFNLGWGFNHYLISLGRSFFGFYAGIYLFQWKLKSNRKPSYSKLGGVFAGCYVIFFLLQYSHYYIILAGPIFYLLLRELISLDQRAMNDRVISLCKVLGKLSYGIYVWHEIINRLRIPAFINKHFFASSTSSDFWMSFTGFMVTTALVLLASQLSYRFFEIHVRKWFSKKLKY